MQGRTAARTVLLEMARDEARAERIRSVIEQRKAEDPSFTTAWIADQLGVSERAVGTWKATGSLARTNSTRLAELVNCDPTWLWLGRKTETPDVLDMLPGTGPSFQVEQMRELFEGHVHNILARIGVLEDRQEAIYQQIEQNTIKLDRNFEATARLHEAINGLSAETVASAAERAAGVAGPEKRSARRGNEDTPHATQG